ncbi:FUSC family protein [Ilumatobacter nonamiensis]|uniref:FUSC family protein n=1 Tax=Ilumatobacter nonamiensis TaxID=467093 RepID=UPI000345B94B|nr:FUSC family protein [Ilumatobacter nonamiensis]
MVGRWQHLLAIDHSKLNLGLAAYAIVGVLVAVAIEALVGVGALQVGIAAVLVVMVGRDGNFRMRMVHMGIVTLVGGAFGFLSYVTAETAWQAALVLAAVTYLTGLAYGLGSAAGRAGYLVLLWAITVLIGESRAEDPPITAAAFLLGGVVAMILVAAVSAIGRSQDHVVPVPAEDESEPPSTRPNLSALVRSGIGIYCVVRAILVAVAVVVGYRITTDGLDPYWISIVVLIVFLPDTHQTVLKGTQRGIGTLVGAVVATLILEVTGSDGLVVVLMLVSSFGAVAFYSANYMIYAFFLTNAVLIYYWFDTDEQLSGPPTRLLATLIGLALAFVGIGLMRLRQPTPPSETTTA